MEAESVLEVLDALASASVRAVVDGGWGVDALLGEQTRPHADLDLIAGADDAQAIRTALAALGFRERSGGSDANFVLSDEGGQQVDVHLVEFDSRGVGSFAFPDGRLWPFPPEAFAGRGQIGGHEVACLSVDAQVQCHGQGYEPTENDLADMERLEERFGVVLPLGLCRQRGPREPEPVSPSPAIADHADRALRERITTTLTGALEVLPPVLAGWESGSIAFDREDAYSDLDLNFLLDDALAEDAFYAAVVSALETVSLVVASHPEPPGRYFKLAEAGDFLLVDVCLYRSADYRERLDVERHGKIRPLFDKGQWLRADATAGDSQAARRAERLADLEAWFSVSQGFVRKAMLRGREVEALAALWAYTLRPLVELLRMRHCPARWDFGMRYLDRDLPAPVYEEVRALLFVPGAGDLVEHHAKAAAWAERLLQEREPGDPDAG